MRLNIFLIFIVLVGMACEREYLIDTEKPQKQLSVNCLFTADSNWVLKLFETNSIYEDKITPIEKASASLFSDGKLIGEFHNDSNEIYRLQQFPMEGKEYTLKVKKEGFPEAWAYSSLPNPIKMLSFKIDTTSNYLFCPAESCMDVDKVSITFKYKNPDKPYFKLHVYKYLKEEYVTYPNILVESMEIIMSINDKNYVESILFDENKIERLTDSVYSCSFFIGHYNVNEKNRTTFIKHYMIILEALNEALFKYYLTVNRQKENLDDENPFTDVLPIFSNVVNGTGIVGGYSRDVILLKGEEILSWYYK